MVRTLFATLIITAQVMAAGCSVLPLTHGPVMAVSVASSGDYAISSHRDNALVLWDLQDRESHVLAENANIYSARFLQGRSAFLWQDLENVVHVETVSGKELRSFEHFPTYGHIMTAGLKTYLSVDAEWNVYSGSGASRAPVLKDGISPSFKGSHKLLNISLSEKKGFFLTAGVGSDVGTIEEYPPVDRNRRFSRYGGVTLWNLQTKKPIARLKGNSAKTHAILSPDGRWVVSGDESYGGLFWNTEKPDSRNYLASYFSGLYLDDDRYEAEDPRNWDKSQLIDPPKGASGRTLANAFIDNSDYFLRFGNQSHIAALYKAGNPWPQKYFDLGTDPRLVTYGSHYSRNTAIATSPEAGVLVMGHDEGGGISVYQYDADQQTLERTWVVE
ncbi:hypothetical protein C8D92_103275 [Tamilnaduibacter salinus]|uniref:WD40 repeat protein n=1 Tax=Tamilnaduibacter salinus TaxID=1484056 RepID=A0A2U1CYM4_9GAMM|nr:WD40 repeat domain-containing protein [Tamilnaduibacter salinus]PVY77588.1 hypothetical protein C8D92_103275 [Tamilnaduibacter salinus]